MSDTGLIGVGKGTLTKYTLLQISIQAGEEICEETKRQVAEAWGLSDCREGGIYVYQCTRAERSDEADSFDFKFVELPPRAEEVPVDCARRLMNDLLLLVAQEDEREVP